MSDNKLQTHTNCCENIFEKRSVRVTKIIQKYIIKRILENILSGCEIDWIASGLHPKAHFGTSGFTPSASIIRKLFSYLATYLHVTLIVRLLTRTIVSDKDFISPLRLGRQSVDSTRWSTWTNSLHKFRRHLSHRASLANQRDSETRVHFSLTLSATENMECVSVSDLETLQCC
jgi:hypothetical protein